MLVSPCTLIRHDFRPSLADCAEKCGRTKDE